MAEPMYWRIAQELRQEIESSHLRAGEQLPTELELRVRFGASRNTIRDAIKWLTSCGLVETRPGQGTFVVERIAPFVTTLSVDSESGLGGGEGQAALAEVRAKLRPAESDMPMVEMQVASGNIATRLRVPEGTPVVTRSQRRYIGGTPWSLQSSFYPRSLAREDDGRVQVSEIFRTAYRAASREDDDGPVPFRLTVSVFPTDRNEFLINLGEVPGSDGHD
jgi:GntR family transcriptional regulator